MDAAAIACLSGIGQASSRWQDFSYALEMAAEAGIDVPAARLAQAVLKKSAEAGNSEAYFPALARIVDGGAD